MFPKINKDSNTRKSYIIVFLEDYTVKTKPENNWTTKFGLACLFKNRRKSSKDRCAKHSNPKLPIKLSLIKIRLVKTVIAVI